MKRLQQNNSRTPARQKGVSVVELMVALLLGLFLLFALVEILINGKEAFGSANHLSRLQENGRIATDLVVSDLKRAGYMGGNSDIPNIFGSAGQAAPAETCVNANTTWGRMITQPIFGINDANTNYACVANGTYLRGDIVTVRYAAPWVETGALSANRMYLRSSLFEGKIFPGANQGDANNAVLDQPQAVRELQAFSYFVGDSGRTCNGNVVPSLFRVSLNDNGQPATNELLPGVEHMQLQYVENGRYVDADDVTNWDDVVSARVWLLIRAECPETGYQDDRTYNMGDVVYDPNDDHRRQLYSSVVTLRN